LTATSQIGFAREERTMRRKTFDALMATGGLVLAIILVIAGGLGVWAHHFAEHNVHSQLSQQ
jgi:heme/copper-type cytochrome/quinol oxidase subunit 1